jgi:PAS domain S-box-containing protein
MSLRKPSYTELENEIASLRLRLAESEPTLEAIRTGEVDAFVIHGSQTAQVVLLEGADTAYRLLMEEIDQGAFTMTPHGKVLYCNQRLAALLRAPREHITGASLRAFVPPGEGQGLEALLHGTVAASAKDEIILRAADGTQIPTRLTVNTLNFDEQPVLAVLVTDLTERKHVEARLDQSAEQLRKLAARLQTAREEERTQIAREIHDELGGALTVLKMDLVRLRQLVPATASELETGLRTVISAMDTMAHSVRRIATHLRPAILDDLGLVAAIEWQLGDFQSRSGIHCQLNSNVADLALDRESSTAVFRVFQEALTNVARHAQATQVNVHLECQASALVLQVQDNGRGIAARDMTGTQSLGLLGMRERIHLLAGEFHVDGAPGQGTRVQIKIPVRGQAA